MAKFEYKNCIYKDLNKLGMDGWEAYAIHHFKKSETVFYLKRKVG